ncbi:MAG: hypothetical protein ACXAEN_20395 [Candidatus Thorarchaeota archaeon]|jgi:hypothetical protein
MIQYLQFIDADDLPEEACQAYKEFCSACGVHNGEPWDWTVGESEDDSVPWSYIGEEKTKVIDDALREFELSDGENIFIIRRW